MHSYTLASLASLVAFATVALAAPLEPRMAACTPPIASGDIVRILSAANSSLSLGTYDCEACTALELLPNDQSSNSEFRFVASNQTGYYTLETPNYTNQCITRTANGFASPFDRAPCVADSPSQDFFSFYCGGGCAHGYSTGCQVRWTNSTDINNIEESCLESAGTINVGGLSLEKCVTLQPNQTWTVMDV